MCITTINTSNIRTRLENVAISYALANLDASRSWGRQRHP